ncbi:MAG TPA: hypothetical protein VFK57_18930 [Vicinamibacterales bacterium]|nr:hypothetical protein [Vicinamibacterales bacterium]
MEAKSSSMERRRPVRLWRLVFAANVVSIMTATAQQLTLDSVALKLGAPDAAAVQQLRNKYNVQRIDGGWSIQPIEHGPTKPGIGVRTVDGRIQSVSFTWGPGFTPTAEEIADQLAQALPSGVRCEVRNVSRGQEGGTVRTLEWLCGTYKVRFQSGVWPQGGNSVTISVEKN